LPIFDQDAARIVETLAARRVEQDAVHTRKRRRFPLDCSRSRLRGRPPR
jgi:hypothetical protein